MPTKQEIESQAKELGELIGQTDAAKQMREVEQAVEKDADTQRLVGEFNQLIQTLSQKQAQGQPIEPEDKKKLEQAQTALATNIQVQRLQKAQMDYMDLLRTANTAMIEGAGGEPDANALTGG